jgi:hypothetical protein
MSTIERRYGKGRRMNIRSGNRRNSVMRVYDYRIAFTRAMGWSQEGLAAIAGVSLPTVKRLKAADGLLGGCEDTGMKLRGLFVGAV